LLASTVASYLGLPDLFDTNTGMSAIGRFGLMDGQSIFAYNGAFPPELSPWEKIRLGWVTPVELTGTLADLTVVTNRIAVTGDTTLIKLRINEKRIFPDRKPPERCI
jgi:M6 family metalloprotease-like protein